MRTIRHLVLGLTLASTAFCTCTAGATAANDPTIVLGGFDVSPSSTYTFVGAIASLNGDLDKSGALVRLWGDRLTYDFQNNGTRIDATSWGHSLSIGYQVEDARGVTSAYAGIDTRSTLLSQNINSPTEGTHTGARFELDTDQRLAPIIRIGAIGSLVTANQDYWTRIEMMAGAQDKFQFGPQFTFQGNPDYHGFRSGLGAENIHLGKHLGASLGLGTQKINRTSGIYTNLGLVLAP